jgi:hypothetical protein
MFTNIRVMQKIACPAIETGLSNNRGLSNPVSSTAMARHEAIKLLD